jgi:hypothetical protein
MSSILKMLKYAAAPVYLHKSIRLCQQKPDPTRETVPLISERLLKCRRTDMFVDGGALAGPCCPQLALLSTRNSCNMLKVLSSDMDQAKRGHI